ncbi:cytochrome ubiquinol oxidase subunit I [Photobacterium sanguinicancri]|uniref:Cytochrome ubiquinol oxidase subunit I n=1 Tax=Photobacterium sanguinicancri TaxID=875932 RepID=A0ABX4FTV5_9GAMM|nr:cytochrome ubiquinol oxidase subunit I [Photobacterium sanguinicancri]OZS42313.1 cytochrome ubiquinol oxidase subunit I [Photobacterium sanguinicancri]
MSIELVDTARLEFALSMSVHQLFVPTFIGVMFMAAILQTLYLKQGDLDYQKGVRLLVSLMSPVFFLLMITGIATPPIGEDWAVFEQVSHAMLGEQSKTMLGLCALITISSSALALWGWRWFSDKVMTVILWIVPFACTIGEAPAIILNGWMQHPVGSEVNSELSVTLISAFEYLTNPMGTQRIYHFFSGALLVGASVLATLSAFYIVKNKAEFATKWLKVSSIVGFILTLSSVISGDIHGREVHQTQPMKLAQIEALWETQQSGAHLVLAALPNMERESNDFELAIPNVLGWMLNGTEDKPVLGIKDLRDQAEERILRGLDANASNDDKAYAQLVLKHTNNMANATSEDVKAAAQDTVNNVPLLFWAFRAMVGGGIILLCLYGYMAYRSLYNKTISSSVITLTLAVYPIAIISYLSGWIVSEVGRQPWVIYEILPTFLGAGDFIGETTHGFSSVELLTIYAISIPIAIVRWFFVVRRYN